MEQVYSLEAVSGLALEINVNMLPQFQVLSRFLLKQMSLCNQADKSTELEQGNKKGSINQDRRRFQTKMIFLVYLLRNIFLWNVI
jgi:hypothetical protein